MANWARILITGLLLQSVGALGAEKRTTPEPAPPEKPKTASAPNRFSLLTFRPFSVLALQAGGGNSLSFGIAWAPSYAITPMFGVRLDLGANLFRGTQSLIFVPEYSVLGRAFLLNSQMVVEAGAGLQTWVSSGGTVPALTVNLAWAPPIRLFARRPQIWMGYSPVLATRFTHLMKIGIAFSLD